jgi:acetylornithine deacetylase/succinyl-diaminopimelate desuccinylase-like protein
MQLNRLIERTLAIQAIPAPTFSEAERSSWVYNEFQKMAFDTVEQDPIGNVYCRIPGGSQYPIIITAHLDTVFSIDIPLQTHKTSERIAGPGIGDNSIAVATLLELAQDFRDRELPGDIWLIANVGEEGLGNLLGMRHIVARFGENVSAYLVVEGMAFGHIYHQGLPVRRFRISAEGPGGHAWIHQGRPSTNHAILIIGAAITQIPLVDSSKTSLNIGSMHGGTSINSIASQSYFEIDLRSEDPKQLDVLTTEIQRIVSAFDQASITIQMKMIGERPGGGLPYDHPLVQSARRALESVGVTQPNLGAGSTDASAPLSMGYPAVCVGITNGGDAHTANEFIELEPIKNGYRSVCNLIDLIFEL